MPHYLAYARKSWINPKSRKTIESTDTQVARIDAWAQLGGHTVEYFVEPDGARSGKSIEHRPAYQELQERLAHARPGEAQGVVVTDLDRSGRSERDLHALFDDIAARGMDLVVLDDPNVDLASSTGRLWAGLKALLAAQERRKASERQRTSIAYRQAQGIFTGNLPYGYRRAVQVRDDGRILRTLEPEPVEAERLCVIYEKYVDERIGIIPLAQWVNDQGWPSKRGGTWSNSTINHLLHKVWLYRGYVQTHVGKTHRTGFPSRTIPGKHPALISDELAEAVIAALNDRARKSGGRPAYRVYPLTGLVFCAACGSKCTGFTIVRKRTGEHPFYRCAKTARSCSQKLAHAHGVEAQVWQWLDTLIAALAPFVAPAAVPEAPAPRRAARKSAAPDPRAIQKEMERLTEVYVKGRLRADVYDTKYAQLEAELRAAQAATVAAPDPDDPYGLADAYALLASYRVALELGAPEALREVALATVERVEIRGETVEGCVLVPELETLRELLLKRAPFSPP